MKGPGQGVGRVDVRQGDAQEGGLFLLGLQEPLTGFGGQIYVRCITPSACI